jgi:hypothetical protein
LRFYHVRRSHCCLSIVYTRWRVKMHVQRLSSAEPHAARRQRDGSTQSNQSSNESTLCLSTTVRIAFGARNLVPFPHNDLIKTQLRHGSNSSRPLLKAAGARHGTNNKSSSTTSPIPSTLYHSNNTTNHTHTHTTQTTCLDNQTSATLVCTRRTTSVPSRTLYSRRRRRRTASTRARTTHISPRTQVRCPLPSCLCLVPMTRAHLAAQC